MSNIKPTSVHVVGWTFVIVGMLSMLSGVLYLFAVAENGQSLLSSWPGLMQVLLAGFLSWCGFSFMQGSAQMRKILELSSYAIAILVLVYGVNMAQEFGSWSLPLVLGLALYLIPIALIVKALRSEKVRTYVSTKVN